MRFHIKTKNKGKLFCDAFHVLSPDCYRSEVRFMAVG